MSSKLTKAIERLVLGGGYIGVIALLSMVALVMVNVILRYFVRRPLVFAEEITGYFQLAIVFLGLGYTLAKKAHIRVDLVLTKLPHRIMPVWMSVVYLVGLVWAIIQLMAEWSYFSGNYTIHALSATSLGTPLWIPALILVTGAFLFLLQFCLDMVRQMRHD